MGCQPSCVSPHSLFKLIGDRIERRTRTETAQRFHRLDTKTQLLQRYRKTGKILGAGINGAVFLGMDQHGRKVAMKTLTAGHFIKEPAKTAKHISREVELLLSVRHPNVVELLDAYEGKASFTIITELLEGGTLQSLLLDREKLLEEEAIPIAKQMFLAIGYLHSHSIVHRDLKPDNFMFVGPGLGEGVLKLIDFGFSKHFKEGKMMKSHKGTLSFMAPEVLQQQYTFKCDTWSLGVVVFRMLTGYLPFQDQVAVHPLLAQNFEEKIQRHILQGKIIVRNKAQWEELSSNAKGFVKSLLTLDQTRRLSSADALRHPWLHQSLSLCPTPVSYSDLNLLPVLSAAAVQNIFSRAFLMLMVWIKVHPGDPYAVSQACETGDIGDTNETVHSCPCVNDGDFVKAIRDPSGAPEPVFSLFKLLNKDTGIHENTLLEMLLGLETSLSKRDVGEAFSLIDTQRKGFLTEYDLKLVFGSEFQGKPMRELITDLHSNNCKCGLTTDDGDTIGEDTISEARPSTITYKELQQHLRLSSENR